MSGLSPGIYIRESGLPMRCHGHTYRLHRLVEDVTSGQLKALIEGLSGPHEGEWFVTSLSHFQSQYKPVEDAT